MQGSEPRATYGGLRPVRTLCMLSIVAYHVRWTGVDPPEPLLGVSFGLTTLQVILCALVARAASAPPAGPFLARRARRLLRPWLLWSAVYVAVKVAQSLRYGHGWSDQLDASMVMVGGSFHLWFLPYGFAASWLALAGLHLTRGRRAAAGAWAGGLLGAVVLLLGTVSQRALAPPPPLDLWLDGAPALLFGLAIGRALSVERPDTRRRLLMAVSALSLLPVLLGAYVAPESQLWARYAVAVPLACAGFLVRCPDVPLLTWLAERNMGVYVVHVLALQAVDRVEVLGGLPDLGRILAVYVLSLGAASITASLSGAAGRALSARRRDRSDAGQRGASTRAGGAPGMSPGSAPGAAAPQSRMRAS